MARNNQAMTDLLRYNAAILPRKRSSFNKSHSHATTLDSAYLVPLMWDRVLPGDEKKIRYSGLARMATPIHPTMDQANLDVWCFYVPDRLWWTHAKEFYGENKDAEFNPDGMYKMPSAKLYELCTCQNASPDTVTYDYGNRGIGSLVDYFGLPVFDSAESCHNKTVNPNGAEIPEICIGLFRSYQLIWNDYFRNSSIQSAVRINTGDDVTGVDLDEGLKIRKVCKIPDYFTSLLKEPQAGYDVSLPLGEWAPVVTRDVDVPNDSFESPISKSYIRAKSIAGNSLLRNQVLGYDYFENGANPITSYSLGLDDPNDYLNGSVTFTNGSYPYFTNLWANLTDATAATVNNLRAAITVQHLLEIDNLAGKFYQRILQAHFGVFTPDATLQRPELLGATRTPIGMRQVLQTSATGSNGSTTPQGNTAAFSLTSVNNEWICNKAFTEPGYLICLGAIRPSHSYSQHIDPLLTKLDRYDHYWPVFDNLGNQPLYKYNVMCSENAFADPEKVCEVFGYQEAWTEYRLKQNRVSGLFRPDVNGTLASWNYSTNFESLPSLTSEFVEEDPLLIDRTIAVTSEPQFLLDSYFDYIDIKNMSVHSIPGLTRL